MPSSAFVPFPSDLIEVHVVKRRNRFVVEATTADAQAKPLLLHLPNSGRMQELLPPGALGLAALDGGGQRVTDGTLLVVHYAQRWVSVDARMPNRLFAAAIRNSALAPFSNYYVKREEFPWGKGRLDFQLAPADDTKPLLLVETKSCNLVEDGLALFPDAPTVRGARHLDDLATAVHEGYRAAVVWFVQRDDARSLAAHHRADPDFARALQQAAAVGVEAYAYRCRVKPKGIQVLDAIPVNVPTPPAK